MDTERTALLFGPYKAPTLKVGDRTSCLYRDAEVVVYNWTIAPIPWPLCYHVGTRAFGKGILVEEELASAIRQESAAAIMHWWAVCSATVRKWRMVLGVGRMENEGSRRLIHRTILHALHARRKHVKKVRLRSEEEFAFLGVLPDEEIALQTGRTLKAVVTMRRFLELPEP